MLVAGYFGESGAWDVFGDSSTEIWFVIGMLGWAWILYELHQRSRWRKSRAQVSNMDSMHEVDCNSRMGYLSSWIHDG